MISVKGTTATHSNVDKFQNHNFEQRKPGLLYDSIFMECKNKQK